MMRPVPDSEIIVVKGGTIVLALLTVLRYCASFATIVTTIDFSRNRELRTAIVKKHIEYWRLLCNNLDQIEKGFKAGKSKDEVLAEFKKPHRNKSMENQGSVKS